MSARAIDVVIETGDSGPDHAGRHQPAQRPGGARALRQQVGVAGQRQRGLRAFDAGGPADRVLLGRGRGRAHARVGRAVARPHHRAARGDRPRFGPHGRGHRRSRRPSCCASSTRRSRKRAPTWWRCTSCPSAEARGAGAACRPTHTAEIVRTEYEQYTRGALLQLRRVREGNQLEEDHMRNRQLMVNWLRRHTTAIEVRRRDGKTYFTWWTWTRSTPASAACWPRCSGSRARATTTAARRLVEEYGVHFDPVAARRGRRRASTACGCRPIPRSSCRGSTPRRGPDGSIVDVDVSYPCDLEAQMLEYSAHARA